MRALDRVHNVLGILPHSITTIVQNCSEALKSPQMLAGDASVYSVFKMLSVISFTFFDD